MQAIKIILKEAEHFKKFHRIITGEAGEEEKLIQKESIFLLQRFEERLRSWRSTLQNIDAANEEDFHKYSEEWINLMGCTQKIQYLIPDAPCIFNFNDPFFDSDGKLIQPISVSIKFYNKIAEVFYRGGVWHSVQQIIYALSELYSDYVRSLFYHKKNAYRRELTEQFYGEDLKPYHLPVMQILDLFFFIVCESMFFAVGGYSYLDNFLIEDNIDSETFVKGLSIMQKAIDAGFGFFLISDKAIAIQSIPKLRFNDRGELHCSNGPAMKTIWGNTGYFYRGIQVNEKIILHPKKLTVKEILSVRHPLVKEVMIEKYGLENFVEAHEHRVLDQVHSDNLVYQLLMLDIQEREPMVVLKVICPSTKKKYYLRVPPGLRKFKEALAWTFGISSRNLDFYLET